MTVDDYHRRAMAGEFNAPHGVELLEGVVVPKSRQSLRHEGGVEKVKEVLQKLLPEGWHLRVQQPIASHDSLPEPDVVIAGRRNRWLRQSCASGRRTGAWLWK